MRLPQVRSIGGWHKLPAKKYTTSGLWNMTMSTSTETKTPWVARKGRCACGSVHYQLANEPLIVHACHCRDCQRLSGTAFALNILTEASNLKLEDPEATLTTVTLQGGSGKPHKVCFCSKCSTKIYSIYSMPAILFIKAGSLDDPSLIKPDVHIFTRSKLPWLKIEDEGIPCYKEFYPIKEMWTPEMIQRWKDEQSKL